MPLPDFGDTAVAEKPKLPDFGGPEDVAPPRTLIDPSIIEGFKGAYFRGPYAGALEEQVQPVPPTPLIPPKPIGEQTGPISLNLSRSLQPISGVAPAYQPNLQLSKPPTPGQQLVEDIGGGVAESAVGTLDTLMSPFGLSTLGIGGVSAPIQKALIAYFTYKMGKEVPEIATKLGEESGKPPEKRDNKLIAKLIADGVTATGFTLGGAMSEISPLLKGSTDLTQRPDIYGLEPKAPPPRIGLTGTGQPQQFPFAPPALPTPLTQPEQERRLLPRPDQIGAGPYQGSWGEQLRMPPSVPASGPMLGPNIPIGYDQPIGPTIPRPGPMGQPALGPWSPPGSVPPIELREPPRAEGGVTVPQEPKPPVKPATGAATPIPEELLTETQAEAKRVADAKAAAATEAAETARLETIGRSDPRLESRKQKLLRENQAIQTRLADRKKLEDRVIDANFARAEGAPQLTVAGFIRDYKKTLNKNLAEIRDITIKQQQVTEAKEAADKRREKKKAVEAEREAIKPTKPPVAGQTGFVTSEGIQYMMDERGRTTRLSGFSRPPGVGMPKNDISGDPHAVVFISGKAVEAITKARRSGGKIILADKQPDGTYLEIKPDATRDIRDLADPHVLMVDEKGKVIAGAKATHTPEVGKHPFEITYKGGGTEKSYHLGHDITAIRDRPSDAPPLPRREGIERLPPRLQTSFAVVEQFLKEGDVSSARFEANKIRDEAARLASDETLTPQRKQLLDSINDVLDQYSDEFQQQTKLQQGESEYASQKGRLPEQILNFHQYEGPGSFKSRVRLRFQEGPIPTLMELAQGNVKSLSGDLGKDPVSVLDRMTTNQMATPEQTKANREKLAASMRMTGWVRKNVMFKKHRDSIYDWIDQQIGPERKELSAEEKAEVERLRKSKPEIPKDLYAEEEKEAETPDEHITAYLKTVRGRSTFEGRGVDLKEFIRQDADNQLRFALKHDPKDPTRWFDDMKGKMAPGYIATILRQSGELEKTEMTNWQRKKIEDWIERNINKPPPEDEPKKPGGGIGGSTSRFSYGRNRREAGAIFPQGDEGKIKDLQAQMDRLTAQAKAAKPNEVPNIVAKMNKLNEKLRAERQNKQALEDAAQRIKFLREHGELKGQQDAIKEGQQQKGGQPEHIGTEAQRLPAETGGGDSAQREAQVSPEASKDVMAEVGNMFEQIRSRSPGQLKKAISDMDAASEALKNLPRQEKLPPGEPGETSQTRPVPPAATAEGSAITEGAEPPSGSPAISEPTAQAAGKSNRAEKFVPEIERVVKAAGGNWREAIRKLAKADNFHFIIPEGMTRDAAIQRLAEMKAKRALRFQEGSVLLPGGGKGKPPDVPPVPPTTLKSLTQEPAKDLYGIAARLREWRARMGFTEPVPPGEGTTWRKAVQRGRDLLATDPQAAEKAVQKFADSGGKDISADMIAVVRAKAEQKFSQARKIELSRGKDAPDWKPTYDEAVQWDEASKPMQTVWHAAGEAQQGAIDLDTGTFTDISRYFKEITYDPTTGKWKEFTPKQTDKAEKIAKSVQQAQENAQEANDAVDYQLGEATKLDEAAEQKRLEEEMYGTTEKPGTVKTGTGKPGNIKVKREEFEKEEAKRKKKIAEMTELTPRSVRKRARELMDQGDMELDTIIQVIADEKGVSARKITELLNESDSMRQSTMEMWRKNSELRRMRAAAKRWIEEQALPTWKLFFKKIPRFMFAAKITGHGAVGMITHAGLNMFNLHTWYFKDVNGDAHGYWPSFWHQWKFSMNEKSHITAMQLLRNDHNYHLARRAGLANDPFHYFDDYQLQQLELIKPLTGVSKGWKQLTDMGQRGFDALKEFRQARFNQIWDNMDPALTQIEVKTKDGVRIEPNVQMARMVADAVNKATGFSRANMGIFTGLANVSLFAPRLELSRWGWLLGDTVKAMDLGIKWQTRPNEITPVEKQFVMHQVKEKAAVVGTYIGLLIANQAILSWQGSKQRINAPILDPDWNARRGDFMAFKAFGAEAKIVSPIIGIVRAFAQLLHVLRTDRTKYEKLTQRSDAASESLGRYARQKLSPFGGVVSDVLTAQDFANRPMPWSNEPVPRSQRLRGEKPYDWSEYLMEQFAPIPLEEGIKELWINQGMSPEDANKWLKGLKALGATMAGSTGARISSDVYAKEDKERIEPERMAPEKMEPERMTPEKF